MTMRLVFWLSLVLIAHAYVGYPLCLSLFTRKKPILKHRATLPVSILIAARNEEATLPAKLENLRNLAYPAHLTQIIIVSDGSSDRTAEILRGAPAVLPIILAKSGGKANALNQAVSYATGEILVFLDARQSVDPDAIMELVACFADPQTGAVSGELLLESAAGGPPPSALGIYWKIEKTVRKLESASGSVVGVTGAIYAIRRELYTPMPEGTILDDVFVPMHVARAGKRVIFEPAAIARDRIFSESGKEFSRKVRTLTGNYQILRIAPWLLSLRNPLLFRFVNHKLARLLVPFLLLTMLVASALAPGSLYRSFFYLQILFYAMAALGLLAPSTRALKPITIATTFLMLNAAAALAFYNFVTGRTEVWT